MDTGTLAAFRASGETDLQKFLQKQAVTADTPPGVPGGYAAGNAAFQGVTSAERGVAPSAPTGQAFLDRIHSGLSALSGLPNRIGSALGVTAQPAAPGNLFAASREADLDALQRRSNELSQPLTGAVVKPVAVVAAAPVTPLAAALATRAAVEKKKNSAYVAQ